MVTVTLAALSSQALATDWVILYKERGSPIFNLCKNLKEISPTAPSPADYYIQMRDAGLNPKIEEIGDKVELSRRENSFGPTVITFFRTNEACEKEIQNRKVEAEKLKREKEETDRFIVETNRYLKDRDQFQETERAFDLFR
jgi:hypothetical protein